MTPVLAAQIDELLRSVSAFSKHFDCKSESTNLPFASSIKDVIRPLESMRISSHTRKNCGIDRCLNCHS
jgi:hypothetical protein